MDPGAGARRPDLARGGEGVALPQHHHALGRLRADASSPISQGLPVQAGDCFVLCSDGLSNYLTVEELAQVLTGHCYRDVPTVFIDLANERGGDDNVTCLAIYAGNEEA